MPWFYLSVSSQMDKPPQLTLIVAEEQQFPHSYLGSSPYIYAQITQPTPGPNFTLIIVTNVLTAMPTTQIEFLF